MSAVLMTLFAVSIVGALAMAFYGLRVLVGRWEQPRRFRPNVRAAAPQPTPVNPPRPAPGTPPPVWVAPVGVVPAPMASSRVLATPLPIPVRAAGSAPTVAPLRAPSPPPPPPARAPSQGYQISGMVSQDLSPRLARGSIPPDFTAEAEPDTDPGVPELMQPEADVQRGARFSVFRSSRR